MYNGGPPPGVTDRFGIFTVLLLLRPSMPKPLLDRAQNGDPHALRELLVAHLPELQVFIRFNAGPDLAAKESVSDLTQSLVGDLLPELPRARFDDLPAFRAWLRRAALNKIIDKQRRYRAACRDQRREAELSASTADDAEIAAALQRISTPSQAATRDEDRQALIRALDRLPPDQRLVVTTVRLLGHSHKDAADLLGKSEQASRQLLSRGMATLSRVLLHELGDGP